MKIIRCFQLSRADLDHNGVTIWRKDQRPPSRSWKGKKTRSRRRKTRRPAAWKPKRPKLNGYRPTAWKILTSPGSNRVRNLSRSNGNGPYGGTTSRLPASFLGTTQPSAPTHGAWWSDRCETAFTKEPGATYHTMSPASRHRAGATLPQAARNTKAGALITPAFVYTLDHLSQRFS